MNTESDKLYEIETPAGLEAKLSDLIDRVAEKERHTKRVARIFWTGGIAASVAILFSIGFFRSTKNTFDTPMASRHIVVEDPEVASREVQKALLQISVNFNKGVEQLNLLSESLEKTNNILDKTIRQ